MNPSAAKIKVCHLASGDLWAGAEVQVANVCRSLLEAEAVEVSAIVLNHGRLADELRCSGVEVTVIDEGKLPWWETLWQLERQFQECPIDILHTHRYKENILGSLAAKRVAVSHVVRTVHGTTEIYSGWKRVKTKVYKALDTVVCRRFVSVIIGVSAEISDSLKLTFPGKTIHHIPNCIDHLRLIPTTEREEKRVKLGLKSSEFVIGTIGRLTPVKGTEYLIRAVAEIIKRREEVRFLVVGDGPLRIELEALVRSMGLEKEVIFLGWRDDTVDIINALDLFVLPSLHEGMPTVLIEAMTLGIPIVASAIGGIPELIRDGWNGLLVDARNPSALAGQCLSMITDASLASRLASNAKQAARKYRSVEILPSLLGCYTQLICGACKTG